MSKLRTSSIMLSFWLLSEVANASTEARAQIAIRIIAPFMTAASIALDSISEVRLKSAVKILAAVKDDPSRTSETNTFVSDQGSGVLGLRAVNGIAIAASIMQLLAVTHLSFTGKMSDRQYTVAFSFSLISIGFSATSLGLSAKALRAQQKEEKRPGAPSYGGVRKTFETTTALFCASLGATILSLASYLCFSRLDKSDG